MRKIKIRIGNKFNTIKKSIRFVYKYEKEICPIQIDKIEHRLK